jgi:xanthine phosphoribosyltransferase
MKELEIKIDREGKVLPGNILKVGSFLNQQIDVDFLMKMGEEIARLYKNSGVTKILTVEASGIALAVAAASYMHVPVVFAKKNKSANVSGDVFCSEVASFTHNKVFTIVISKDYISADDTVLIIDDFLACGNAIRGLMDITNQAGASLAGCAIAIEKGFQGGGDQLRSEGVRVESLAIIDEMDDTSIRYRS